MLTLDGLTEPASEAALVELREEALRARNVADAHWKDERNRPPASLTNREHDQQRVKREWKAIGDNVAGAMWLDAAEVQMFVAERKRLLAEYGFDDSPFPYSFTIKSPPERLGALLCVVFLDRLSCVDPKRWVDATFVPEAEMLEVWWNFHAPKHGAKRWLAKRKVAGRPWEPDSAAIWPETTVTREEFKKVRAMLYPDGGYTGNHPRRYLTPAEAQEAYRAAFAEINGEPPHAISMLMKLDVDNLTPVQALSALKHLQDVARRRDIGPRLLDSP